jgi:ribosome modulation factor
VNNFPKSRALRGAFLKGMRAGLAGHLKTECPYIDRRKPSGKLSWSRAFINAWHDGWAFANEDKEQALITAQYTSAALGMP